MSAISTNAGAASAPSLSAATIVSEKTVTGAAAAGGEFEEIAETAVTEEDEEDEEEDGDQVFQPSPLPPIRDYASEKEALQAVNEWAKPLRFAMKILRGRTDRSVLACIRAGKPPAKPQNAKRKRTASIKCNCLYSVNVVRLSNGRWEIRHRPGATMTPTITMLPILIALDYPTRSRREFLASTKWGLPREL